MKDYLNILSQELTVEKAGPAGAGHPAIFLPL